MRLKYMRKLPCSIGKECITVLRDCALKKELCTGNIVHAHLLQLGLLDNRSHVANSLIDVYAKCGDLLQASRLFQSLPYRDVVSWTALIQGFVRHGHSQEALRCYQKMQDEGLSPNALTLSYTLRACARMRAADKGQEIHDVITKQGLLKSNIVLGNQLVDMYAKCGALKKAHHVLLELPARDIVSWSALITGYADWGHGQEALSCLADMQQEGLSPDAVTFTSILAVCGSIGELGMGKYIHTEIARRDLLPNHPALGNSLVDMYAKCGHLITAEQVFKGLPVPGTIAWSALISGYVQHGQADKALDCYKQMECKGLFPNAVTFASVLKACGCVGAAEIGGQVHEVILKEGLLANDYVLGSALVDMYTKCSCLSKAHQVLEQLPAQNVFSWNALMAGYAHQGRSDDVLYCFKQMQSKGISPDAVTFSTLLNICSHNGLVEEGQMFFGIMSSKFSIEPSTEHYTCMVDLLGRSGHLDTAVTLIKKMPAANHSVIWSALLGACQKWDDVHVGKWAFEHAIQVDKYDDTAYIVMIKIYTGAGLDTEAERVKAMRAEARHEKAQRHCVC